MKGLIKFFLILGAVIFFLFAIFTFLISVNMLSLKESQRVMDLGLENIAQLNVGLIGGILALISLLISAAIFYASLKEKIVRREIAFGNPLGEVKVSLAAISEFVKKLGDQIEEVKEIKPRVVIGKKGLEIYNKITLFSDSNIPEASDRVQTIVKRYVQDVLGIQEVNEVKVFVEKIIPRETRNEGI
jgi:uncharacterized alkaline shock family protein YloU